MNPNHHRAFLVIERWRVDFDPQTILGLTAGPHAEKHIVLLHAAWPLFASVQHAVPVGRSLRRHKAQFANRWGCNRNAAELDDTIIQPLAQNIAVGCFCRQFGFVRGHGVVRHRLNIWGCGQVQEGAVSDASQIHQNRNQNQKYLFVSTYLNSVPCLICLLDFADAEVLDL